MPLLADRVKETTTTTGTGALTLDGATTGYQSFTTAFGNGVSVYYVIAGGAEWEVGIGTTGAGTLSRDTVLQSSNADALVPFSAGVKDVFCSYVADRAVTTSDLATLTNKTIDDISNFVGANQLHVKVKATENLAKGDVCKVTGWNAGENAIEVARVSAGTDIAFGMTDSVINIGDLGTLVNTGFVEGLNTNSFAPGTILYPNTSGGVTSTKPSSGQYQAVAFVLRQNLNNGVVYVEFTNPQYVEVSTNTSNTLVLRDGSGNFAAGTITATLTGNSSTATALSSSRTFALTGDVTGSVSSDLTSGASISTAIANGVIVDADINDSAAIADTKLATISTAGKVANSATTATAASTASTIALRNASGQTAVKGLLVDGTSSGTVTVQGAAAAGTWALTLPTTAGTNGHVLTTNGSGVTSWAAASGSVSVASSSTNATFYPVFFNAATGTATTLNTSSFLTINPGAATMGLPTITINGGIYCSTSNPVKNARFAQCGDTYVNATISAGTLTIDLSNFPVTRVTRNANITTISINNVLVNSSYAQSFTLIFDSNGTAYTVNWPASVKWPGGTAPTLTSTAGRSDVFVFYTNNSGTTWYAMTAAQNFVTT